MSFQLLMMLTYKNFKKRYSISKKSSILRDLEELLMFTNNCFILRKKMLVLSKWRGK
jgi:adenine-specific DNA methylase